MCGIVGLFCKSSELEPRLGELLSAMLVQMSDRGPDSAGVAVYRDPAPDGSTKLTLYAPDPSFDWGAVGGDVVDVRARHAVVLAEGEAEQAEAAIRARFPELRAMSAGRVIEIYKEVGLPAEFARAFRIQDFQGSHGLGHTRMATESRVTTEGSHPFSTGRDLCLVHNGSLSNHNVLRQWLRRRGLEFDTDNDTEVAARYFAYRLSEGASLEEAMEAGLKDLDGFYTFTMSTRDGFAVLRDGIACKPAVLAETDEWVAMASEFRSLADLPGVEAARIWEPEPAVIYTWSVERAQ
jgi:methylamine---glutamate N-methyltransferase subunit A